MTIDPKTMEDVKGWLTTNAKDYWTAADLAKAAAKEFDLFMGSDWTSFERDIPDEVVSAAEIAWHLWNDDDLQEADDHTVEDSRKLDKAVDRLMDRIGLYATKTGYKDASQEDKDKLVKLAKEAIPKMEELINRYKKSDFPDGAHHLESQLKKLKAYAAEEVKEMKNEPESSDKSSSTRKKLETDAWKATHKDFKSKLSGVPHVLVMSNKGTTFKALSDMSDDELRKRAYKIGNTNEGTRMTKKNIKEELSDKDLNDIQDKLHSVVNNGSFLVNDIDKLDLDPVQRRELEKAKAGFEQAKNIWLQWLDTSDSLGESEEHEYVRDPSLPDDFEECGYCGFDHEYEALEANQWHEENPGQGYDESAMKTESADELFNIVVVNDKTKKKKYLTSSPLSHSEATTMLKKQSAPAKKELRIKLEPVTKDLAAKKPWLDSGSHDIKEGKNTMIIKEELSDEGLARIVKFWLAKIVKDTDEYTPKEVRGLHVETFLEQAVLEAYKLGENREYDKYKEEPNQMNSGKEVAVDEGYETDEDAKTELALYMDNEYSIYNQKKSIIANLMRKMKSGKYDPILAPKLWAYWVESGAKAYAKEFATPGEWSKMFPKPLRDALAAELAKDEEEKIKNGEYGSDPSKL